MTRHHFRPLLVCAAAMLVLSYAAPASAQQGTFRGKVVDQAGKPVPEAELVFDFVGDYNRQFKTLTDKNGEFIRAGLPAGTGRWNITVKKGDLSGSLNGAVLKLGELTRLQDIVVTSSKAEPGTNTSKAPANMSADDVAKRNKRQDELKKMFEESAALMDVGKFDEALEKLAAINKEIPECGPCYARMGDVYAKKPDLAEAEKAYLQAIQYSPDDPGAYNALASIYNTQKKLDEAGKMAAKAASLSEAAGGGGGDASSIYNHGIVLWNQGKAAEAKDQFEKATKLDPKMADAHYYLGLMLVNMGKLPDAKAPLQEYLKLAPTGANAATAKALLDTIK